MACRSVAWRFLTIFVIFCLFFNHLYKTPLYLSDNNTVKNPDGFIVAKMVSSARYDMISRSHAQKVNSKVNEANCRPNGIGCQINPDSANVKYCPCDKPTDHV